METTPALIEDMRFPVGKFDPATDAGGEARVGFIASVRSLPAAVAAAAKGLTEEQLDTAYRPGGWTVRQTVHHIADSHLNAYCRFKLALTEDAPTIRPYHEDLWAELADSRLPVEASLKIIEGVHERWTALLDGMSEQDFGRVLNHPETGEWTLAKMLGLYSWHGRHHTAHITKLRERNGW